MICKGKICWGSSNKGSHSQATAEKTWLWQHVMKDEIYKWKWARGV